MDSMEQSPPTETTPRFFGSVGALAAALSKAQGAMENPKRDRTVKVRTKTGAEYEFSYATLSAVLDAIRQPLADNGLCFTQTLGERSDKYTLRTTLLHASGETLVSETPLLVQEQGNQAFGSALTYMKRYALCALLGVSADEDDDGNAGDGNSIEKKVTRDVPKKAAPQVDEASEKARALFREIQTAIKDAKDTFALGSLMQQKVVLEKLALIKAQSATGYEQLMELATKRQQAMETPS
jgi:hypothetical protein